MDPVSFAASLVTLTITAGQSYKVVSKFILDIHDAPKDIHALSNKLQCIRQSFCHHLSVLKALPSDLQQVVELQEKLTSFIHEIDSFAVKIQGMGIRLDQGRLQKTWERVKWLALDRELKRFNQSLDQWERILAAAASAAQLSMSKIILEQTTALIEVHRGTSRGAASCEQAMTRITQGSSSSGATLQVPHGSIPERLSMFLSAFREAVDLRIQKRLEYLGDTMTAIVQSGPVMVRSWSITGQDTYVLLSAAEAYGLASVFQITRLLPGRLSFKMLAVYSSSSIFQIDVRWKLTFAGLLSFDSSAYYAVTTGEWLFLRDLLVNKEIKITHRTIYGDTLLHIATEHGHVELVRELLSAGADVNATNDEGDNALHTAVKTACDYEIIRLLLKSGANLHHQNHQARTPLHCYYNTTIQQTIQYSQDEIDSTTQDYLGMTVAHYTAYSKSSTAEDIARCVKDITDPFVTRDIDGRTLLHRALHRGNIALIQYILNDPRAEHALLLCDWEGQTPLHFATASPRTQAIDLVLDMGFDIHTMDLKGRTALHHAAGFGNLAAVEKLLDRGAMLDLEKRDQEGKTPLMVARSSGRREVVDYLRPLCGDVGVNEVEENLGGKTQICEGGLRSRAWREHTFVHKRFAIFFMGLVGLLVYTLRYNICR